jgi:hypothetical protein
MQLRGDGILDLSFTGPSTAGDQFLDAGGRIADDRQPSDSPGQKKDTTGMGHEDSGARMGIMGVELLDGQGSRLPFLQHFDQTIVEDTQAFG